MWRGYAKNRPRTQRRICPDRPERPESPSSLGQRPALPQGNPRQQRANREHWREDRGVDEGPAEARQKLAGGEGAERHRAENQEIVERLDLVVLLGAVATGHQGGGADEREIPADPQ